MKIKLVLLLFNSLFLFTQINCFADGSGEKDDISITYLDQFYKQVPEIDLKTKEIDKLSQGEVHLAISIDIDKIEGGQYYSIHVFEDHNDHIVTVWWFRINVKTFIVEYYSVLNAEYISLNEWRSNKDLF